jgi:myo-inositol-1(or 4)-monophosphatase
MSESFATVAAEAALKAGAIQKERYGTRIQIDHKGEIDLVTEIDRQCEAAIVDLLRERFPEHDIVTEESDLERRGSSYVWFVDPLDGTTNYAHAYPFFCTSIALTFEGEVVAGAVFDPIKQELFTAERGAGSFLNGRRLRVSSQDTLLRSLLVTGFPYDLKADLSASVELFGRFLAHARAIRRDGAAALDLCYVAAGRVDGFWEGRLNLWDILAGALMIEEAGGRVTRYDDTPLAMRADEVLGTNGVIHEAMLAVLAEGQP